MYADSLKRILKRTDERRGCIVGWLTFWNPKNLQKKVDMYGYHFSWKTHAVMIFLALAGIWHKPVRGRWILKYELL